MRKAALSGACLACALLAGTAHGATIKTTVRADGLIANGNCTLREAVEAANTNMAVEACPKGQAKKPDRIVLKKGEYELGAGDDDTNAAGDLDIGDGGKAELLGKGLNTSTIDAPASDRAIDLLDGGRLKVRTLTVDGGAGDLRGGAIAADAGDDGSLLLDRVKVRGGQAQFGGGVGVVDSKLRIKRSVIVDNLASVSSTGLPGVQANGGGVYLLFVDDARISDTVFDDNDARMIDSTAQGGAIYASSGSADASFVVRRSLFTGNDAYSQTSDATSTRRGGAVGIGGSAQSALVVNSTFFLNRALGAGGEGGALYVAAGTAELVNLTFSSNQAPGGGSAVATGMGTTELSRSALDGVGQAGALCEVSGGTFTSGGYNVAAPDPEGCDLDGPKDALADPGLVGGPADHGGRTHTIKLAKASPARDRIPKKRCGPAEGTDQRGYRRPAGKGCDSGAFERGASPG